jgi:hypothetical protein
MEIGLLNFKANHEASVSLMWCSTVWQTDFMFQEKYVPHSELVCPKIKPADSVRKSTKLHGI